MKTLNSIIANDMHCELESSIFEGEFDEAIDSLTNYDGSEENYDNNESEVF